MTATIRLIKPLTIGLAGLLMLTACQNAPTREGQQESTAQEDTKEMAEDKNEAKFGNDTMQDRAQFLIDVAESNYIEIKMAKLAEEKSTNAEVKRIAGTLEKDHTAVLDQLKSLAAKKSISIPTAETQDANNIYNRFVDKKATEFDKDWCDELIERHKKSISKFEDARTTATDPDIKNWANQTLPKLRMHLDMLTECNNKLQKK